MRGALRLCRYRHGCQRRLDDLPGEVMESPVADLALPQLEAQRKAIEEEIGEPLQWNPYPGKQDKIIVLDRAADLDDHSKWDGYISWLVERVDKFRKAFGPRVKALKLTQEAEHQSL
jgi:Domain of unknown function (DUF4268)